MDDTRINTLPDSDEDMRQNIDTWSDKIDTGLDATMHDLEMEAGNKDKERVINTMTDETKKDLEGLKGIVINTSQEVEKTSSKFPDNRLPQGMTQAQYKKIENISNSSASREWRVSAFERVATAISASSNPIINFLQKMDERTS